MSFFSFLLLVLIEANCSLYCNVLISYKNLKNMINNDKLAIVSGDKDSCVVIMTREDYNDKLLVLNLMLE